ncbi:unnamed protein product [Medioppia subpectinata]|uniref:DNA polymerase epsilon subunit 3 n=1 Tax=Medioppia subpectinata TaxID=1979941 RepID=A0A7R9PZ76_9ACAR|nr:unnamed protein product [Medioppia subpectinata]CAG2106802.1 unnamed protein product [Medioppia subpectinata]
MAEKPEDFNMPSNVVAKIIKESLPSGVNVSADVRSAASRMSADVRSAASRSASIFILYVTTCANSIAIANKRKTLTAQDVIEAMNQIDFEDFAEELTAFQKTLQKDKNQKLKNKSEENTDSQDLDHNEDNGEEEDDEEDEEVEDDDDEEEEED